MPLHCSQIHEPTALKSEAATNKSADLGTDTEFQQNLPDNSKSKAVREHMTGGNPMPEPNLARRFGVATSIQPVQPARAPH